MNINEKIHHGKKYIQHLQRNRRYLTTNSQLTTELKKKKKTKQTTRTGTESQKWRSHGGLSVGKGRG